MMINQRLFLFTALLVFILIFSGCGSDDDSEQSSDPAQDEDDNDSDDDDDDDNDDDNIPEPFCEINEDAIDAMIAKMTLEQRAAQLLVLGEMAFPFLIPEKTEKLITDLGIGGMALQFLNALFPGPARMSNLLNELNGMAMGREPGIPLFFAVDQEGGTTQTWQSITGATDGPGNMALGALDDVDATYRMYAMMGREARAFGANTSYSPELDLVASHEAAWVYTKGFGESGELAGRHAKAAIKGFRSELILGAMKHFPAGGCVWEDTHAQSPTCDLSFDELMQTHFLPFIEAIEAGAEMVMVSPVIYPALDSEMPAAMSAAMIQDFLRGELGFDGLITTGDFGMPPYQHDWELPKEVLAVKAGVDQLLYVDEIKNYQDAQDVVSNIADAVRDGTIPADQFDQTIRRILRYKQKYCLFEKPYTDPAEAESANGTEENLALAGPIVAEAITLVRNDKGLWPMEQNDGKGLLVVSPMKAMLYDPASTFSMLTGTTLAEQVALLAPKTQTALYMPGSFSFLLNSAANKAADPAIEKIVIGTFNAHYEPAQSKMVRDIIALGKPVILIAFGTPFDLMSFSEASTFIAVYSIRDLAIQKAAEILFGQHDPLGRLPVTLPGLYDAGHSAYLD